MTNNNVNIPIIQTKWISDIVLYRISKNYNTIGIYNHANYTFYQLLIRFPINYNRYIISSIWTIYLIIKSLLYTWPLTDMHFQANDLMIVLIWSPYRFMYTT